VNSTGTGNNSNTVTTYTLPGIVTATSITNIDTDHFTANWNSIGGATGYYLDVSVAADFSSYIIGYQNLNVGNVISKNVSGLNPYTTYYYRVRAYNTSGIGDTSNIINDTTLYNGPIFYVNDNSTSNDAYTSGLGNDTLNIGNQLYPYFSVSHALSRIYPGCTIYIDAGTYNETITITKNNISIIGTDSSLTILDFNDSDIATNALGIYAENVDNLVLKNFQIKNYYRGIDWINVTNSRIENLLINYSGHTGIFFENNCDTNILINNVSSYNIAHGFNIYDSSDNNVITYNISSNNGAHGFNIQTSGNNIESHNIASNNVWTGFRFEIAIDNVIENNISLNNSDAGFYLNNLSNNNIISNNVSSGNTNFGIYLKTSNNNYISNNYCSNNYISGFRNTSSNNNYFAQNTLDSNVTAIEILLTSSTDTFTKNNIITSSANPDSGIYNSSAETFNFSYNYWSTTDSNSISKKIKFSTGNIQWLPFRCSLIDTSINADTVAPENPDFIDADTSILKKVTLRWNKPALDENGNSLSGLSGYKIYRAKASECYDNGDTDNWEQFLICILNTDIDTYYVDTGYNSTDTYYYRITAFDSHYSDSVNFKNQSNYSQNYIVFAQYNTKPETPVLISPVNLPFPYTDYVNYGRLIKLKPNLIWQCPIDEDSNTLHFKIFCDSGNGSSLLANSQVDTTGFYYYDSGIFKNFPIAGIDSNVYGNTIYYTPQFNFNDSVYFWSIQAYDGDLESDSSSISAFKSGGRIWTDSPLIENLTLIRKPHIDELRQEINFARKARGLPAFAWTDPVITAGETLIRKIYFDEMRNALEELSIYSIEQQPVWYGNIIAGQTLIKKIYFEELRNFLKL
jgi:parallel beta-helix repeat protein